MQTVRARLDLRGLESDGALALPGGPDFVDGRITTLVLYAVGTATLVLALQLRAEQHRPRLPAPPHRAPERRDTAADPDRPLRLRPDDALGNARVLSSVLLRVPEPGEAAPPGTRPCAAAPRLVPIQLDGQLSLVHFGARAVCQLAELKRISAAQPQAGAHGVGEVAAFVLGVRHGDDVQVSRLVVPPFRFTGETLTFEAHDLGPLQPGERFLGTWHTHPDGDLEQGLLSFTDLVYMRTGYIDFHGAVGALARPGAGADWLFDIVDPREGDWNVYAHDGRRLRALTLACQFEARCPLNGLRLPGSPWFLQARYYQDRGDARPLFEGIERGAGVTPTLLPAAAPPPPGSR